MKEQLKNLYTNYKSKFVELTTKFDNHNLHGPLLISPNELYKTQKHKFLVIGQETNGWSQTPNDILRTMEEYENFNLGSEYNSPFWDITRKLEKVLGIERCACVWSNINKFDDDGTRPQGDIVEDISKFDELLLEEIKILQPKTIVFFTGPDFDFRINKLFNGIKYEAVEGFTERGFSKLIHPDLPEETYRTYHPKYLRIKELEKKFIQYFEKK